MIDSLAEVRIDSAKYVPIVRGVIERAIADAVKAWRIASARRRIAVELSALNDHMLKDIGVPRSTIQEAACMLAIAGNDDRQA